MKRLSSQAYIDGVLAGDRVRLSQAITLVESALPADRILAQEVVQACMPHTGRSFRLGITGVPGVGKSTFIDSFGALLTAHGHRLAVLAIDPTSQLTRGSILGDKTRMERLSHDLRAYVRPSPAGDSLGGVARKTREAMLLCEAAGFDMIIVETVGVGQSETAVHSMTDMFLLLMLPNAGDELQGIKKGIMEMADAVVINKADGGQEGRAKMALAGYSSALRLFPRKESGWQPHVMLASALAQTGLEEIRAVLEAFRTHVQANGYREQHRKEQALQWLRDTVAHRLLAQFYADTRIQAALPAVEASVTAGTQSPIAAAEALLGLWE